MSLSGVFVGFRSFKTNCRSFVQKLVKLFQIWTLREWERERERQRECVCVCVCVCVRFFSSLLFFGVCFTRYDNIHSRQKWCNGMVSVCWHGRCGGSYFIPSFACVCLCLLQIISPKLLLDFTLLGTQVCLARDCHEAQWSCDLTGMQNSDSFCWSLQECATRILKYVIFTFYSDDCQSSPVA